MRKARYDLRQVICPNSSCIGYSSNIAKPGYWITVREEGGERYFARVLGRIADTDYLYSEPQRCVGWLAVVRLFDTFCGVRWVHPAWVRDCWEKPPRELLAWLTGDEWVKNKDDIARIIAMNEHGTLSEEYIGQRHDPAKAYNARPEYVQQFILKE